MQPLKSIPFSCSAPEKSNVGLTQTEQAFSLLVESVKDYAIFMVDARGFVTTWNKGAERIKGYKAAEIIGKHLSVFYTQHDRDLGLPEYNLQKAAENGSHESEGMRQRKDGSLFWADVVFTTLYDDDGNLKGFAKVTRDITDRKNIEGKLGYAAQLVEKIPDAIFSYDSSLRLLSWNKAAEKLFGYTADEVFQKNSVEVLRTVIDEENRARIRKEIANKKNWAGEVFYKRKDGSAVPVEISISAIKEVEGQVEEYMCICRDITEKKELESQTKNLQAENDELQRLRLETSIRETSAYKYALDKSSIVAITNQKGIITYVNENFCTISGYAKDELIGQDHRLVSSSYHPKEFIRNLWVTIANGQVWKGELRNKAKNGTCYWVDTTIVPFLDTEGKPYQYVAIRADISERKRAEEALHLLNEQLEERVQARTKELEVANKEMEAFSYSVSHDLRAPLRGVSGFARILQEDYGHLLDQEGLRVLNKIINSAASMGMLIDDLLTFSRIGRKDVLCNTIDMNALANDCLAKLEPGTNCLVQIQPMPPCSGDITLLKQVWLNLLGNAIKYSSKAPYAFITAGGTTSEKELTYFVKDNGVGFDMQYYHKLFGVFQRLHSSEDFQGTGVGLALVKLIVNKHHGEVWAEGLQGQGATFYFNLPSKQAS